jgi:predicted RNA-binding Zn-ribbon protein involved in translation (DUF1610 family)
MNNNVNVTIKVDGLGEQTVLMPFALAVEVFTSASRVTADKLVQAFCSRVNYQEVSSPVECVTEDPVKAVEIVETQTTKEETNEEVKEETLKETMDPYEEWVEKQNHTRRYDRDIVSGNPFSHEMFLKRKLVAYKCPDCGQVTVRFLVLGESNVTHCHWCKHEVVINEVQVADVSCPNCNTKSFIYLANKLDMVNCKTCESPIDIIYYQDGNRTKAKSANLL